MLMYHPDTKTGWTDGSSHTAGSRSAHGKPEGFAWPGKNDYCDHPSVGEFITISSPFTKIFPLVGFKTPYNIFINVDFPAPFSEIEKVKKLIEEYHFQIDPMEKIQNISVGLCQPVSLFCFWRRSRLIANSAGGNFENVISKCRYSDFRWTDGSSQIFLTYQARRSSHLSHLR